MRPLIDFRMAYGPSLTKYPKLILKARVYVKLVLKCMGVQKNREPLRTGPDWTGLESAVPMRADPVPGSYLVELVSTNSIPY